MAIKKGDDQANRLKGTAGNDTIFGYGGDDIIIGGKGDDTLSGGTGKDVFVLDTRDWGNDTITDWGNGDRIDVSALNITSFAVLKLLLRSSNFGVGFAVRTNGKTASVFLENTDQASLNAADFVFATSTKALQVKGTAGDDTLFGANGNDTISSGTGNDVMAGGGGKDVFLFDQRASGYDLILDFESGDRVDLSAFHVSDFASILPLARNSDGGVRIDLQYNQTTETIVLYGRTVASLSAKDFAFDLSGKPVATTGTDVVDTLFGGTGDDRLTGGRGYDYLAGGAGDDVLDASADGGTLYLGGGNDRVVLSQRFFGTDMVFDFGAGDTIDVSRIGIGDFSAIKPFLTQASPTETLLFMGVGAAVYLEGVKLASIGADDFVFEKGTVAHTLTGNDFDDFLIGGAGGDQLTGNGGSDVLSGGAGRDTLIGGVGGDRLYGGDGADRFVYLWTNDSTANQGALDHIEDFVRKAGDRIDLSAIDANPSTTSDDAFKFIGTKAFTGAAGEVRYEVVGGSAHVYVNAQDHASTPYQLEFVVDGVTDLKAADFIL